MASDNGHGWPKRSFRTPWTGWFTRRYGPDAARDLLSAVPSEDGQDFDTACKNATRPFERGDHVE